MCIHVFMNVIDCTVYIIMFTYSLKVNGNWLACFVCYGEGDRTNKQVSFSGCLLML